ncbi:MAG: ribonuclease VapC43 [Candidatus Binatia bacterium]|nr:MAG: ribonuclease VapC43 [Candidatus Binatia bacterium]
MIAVDTNILVYAHRRESRHHTRAAELLRSLAEGPDTWAIAWPCLYEFFSVVTSPRIWRDRASTPDQAWRQIEAWTASPSVCLLTETDDFLPILEGFARRPRVRGPVVHDARVAALCVAHGVTELLTADRDFSLFPELPVRNPLRAREP